MSASTSPSFSDIVFTSRRQNLLDAFSKCGIQPDLRFCKTVQENPGTVWAYVEPKDGQTSIEYYTLLNSTAFNDVELCIQSLPDGDLWYPTLCKNSSSLSAADLVLKTKKILGLSSAKSQLASALSQHPLTMLERIISLRERLDGEDRIQGSPETKIQEDFTLVKQPLGDMTEDDTFDAVVI